MLCSLLRFMRIAMMLGFMLLPTATKATVYNYHAFFYYNASYYDSFQYVSTSGLTSSFPYDPNSFSTIEQWRGDAYSNYTWTEIGWVEGNLNNQYWSGFFGAYRQAGMYHEFPIGLEGEQSISNSGLYAWSGKTVAYVFGGNPVSYVNTPSYFSQDMQSGLESNSSYAYFNTFTPGINTSVMAEYAGGSSWYTWPSNPLYIYSYNDSPLRNGRSSVIGYYVNYPNNEPHADWYHQ